MQKRYYLFPLLFLLFFSCDKFLSNDPDPVNVSGIVTDSSDDPVEGATVAILSPSTESTITDSEGVYNFSLLIEENTTYRIEVSKDGYQTATREFTVDPSNSIDFPDIQLALPSEDNDDDDNNDDEPDEVGGETGGAASIILEGLSDTFINIAETGGNVNSTFTFVVQDSAGRAIDLDKAVDVQFLITEGPGGNEAITPEVVTTNSEGRATASLFSGNIAGNVKVEALIERTDIELTIRSKPILLAIHGGFPDLDHFSISASIFNFEAFDINGQRNAIMVLVGDEFSNPVKPGTPVYFSTTGGVIQGSGQTDDDGEIEVELISGDPRPDDGYATITAHTFDKDDNRITRDIQVLFSTAPTNNNITVTPGTFDIPPNGSEAFTMEITDRNGNPLPAETTITVEPAEGMDVEGDVEISVPNTLSAGPGVTEFSFTARDNDDEKDDSQDVSIVITVETPAGYTARKTISGMKAKQF
ncbi:MAG: carboxypeptidase-like regulatory domain-containing protein [Balneolaceae bacterium]